MGGLEKISQFLPGRKARHAVLVDKGRDDCWDGKTRFTAPAGMTAAPPAILVIRGPDAAELVGEALALVAVTGHTPMPVEVSAQLIFGGIGQQRWLDQRIVGWCG